MIINIDVMEKNICAFVTYTTVFGWVLSGSIQGNTVHTCTTTVIPSENTALYYKKKKNFYTETTKEK